MPLARPERSRFTLTDDTAGSVPLALPRRRMWPFGLVFLAMFAVFAGVLWTQVGALLHGHPLNSVFDLTIVLFQGAWILGWSVGTLFLGAITILLLFHRESARLAGGKLIYVPSLGPLKFVAEYELARMRNLRAETVGGKPDRLRLKFNYGGADGSLGDTLSRAEADAMIAAIRRMSPSSVTDAPPARPAPAAIPAAVPAAAPPPLTLGSPSSLVLIAANLLPLAGVVSGQITLGQVMILFWSESAIIGFFTLVKMAVVGKWAALFSGPFFAAHFGGFMAIHFMFIYGMFVGGMSGAPEPPALEALAALYRPLWPAAAALFVSHAVSFALNFIGRGEFRGETVNALMTAPYRRIIVLHLTIIFGGWVAMLVESTAPAVALLIGMKVFADLRAHTREHAVAPPPLSG